MTPEPLSQTPPSSAAGWRPWRSLLAIVVGVVIDVGGTNVASACYSIFVVVPLVSALAQQGLSQAEIQAQLQQALTQAATGSPIVSFFGLLASILGGYVAGLIARRAEVLHGLAVGFGVTLVSVTLTWLLQLEAGPIALWLLLLALLANWGSTTLGGLLALWRRRRRPRRHTRRPD